MKKIKFLSLSLTLLFVCSCSKDATDPETENSVNLSPKSNLQSQSGNPFNYLGNVHNDFMAYSNTQSYQSLDQLYNQGGQFIAESGIDVSTLDHDTLLQGVSFALNNSSDFSNGLTIVSDNGYISDIVYQKMLLVAEVMTEANSPTPEILVNSLASLEQQFIQLQINDNDKAILLSSIAIARHSVDYWIAYYSGGAAGANPGQAARASWFSRVFGGAVADVFGAVIGGGIGSPVGAVVGAAVASGAIQAAIEY